MHHYAACKLPKYEPRRRELISALDKAAQAAEAKAVEKEKTVVDTDSPTPEAEPAVSMMLMPRARSVFGLD